jgi:hypothetical protein
VDAPLRGADLAYLAKVPAFIADHRQMLDR